MTTDQDIDEGHKAFRQIWTQRQELQNWSSSSWWFFVLLPKQEDGYGPKQMMFTFASRSGELIKVNQTWQPGFEKNRQTSPIDQFMTTVVGWINDGTEVHEEIVHQPALATLDGQRLHAWVMQEDGTRYGAEIQATCEFEIQAHFNGPKGYAKFKVWSHPEDYISLPKISDIRGPAHGRLGGTHLVAWRKLNFKGEFKHPNGLEELEGVGYFQRVCMNVPMFPWKWVWVVFDDQYFEDEDYKEKHPNQISMFSCFVPYFGLQNFRRSDSFFSPWLERMVKPIIPTAYFNFADSDDEIVFDTVEVIILDDNGTIDRKKPKLYIHAQSENGDYLKMIIQAHAHAQFLLDRRVIARIWQTMYNYNEFPIKVLKMRGKIGDRVLSKGTLGQGWGNLEYTWGMSL